MLGLSLLLRGTLLEKLEWTFSLYDINGDGVITSDEMFNIVSAVYDIVGKYAEPRIDETTIRDHVDTVFKVIVTLTYFFTSYQSRFHRPIPNNIGIVSQRSVLNMGVHKFKTTICVSVRRSDL